MILQVLSSRVLSSRVVACRVVLCRVVSCDVAPILSYAVAELRPWRYNHPPTSPLPAASPKPTSAEPTGLKTSGSSGPLSVSQKSRPPRPLPYPTSAGPKQAKHRRHRAAPNNLNQHPLVNVVLVVNRKNITNITSGFALCLRPLSFALTLAFWLRLRP